MLTSLVVAGFGGQGVMMIGKLISECAFEQNLHVTFFPSYGPEQRGGAANCTVVQSDIPIGSPVCEEMDVLCAMNQVALDKFINQVAPGGVVLVNSSTADPSSIVRKDITVVAADADNIAYSLGSSKVANVIMFAAYMAIARTMPLKTAKEIALAKLAKKPEFIEMNSRAFDAGAELAQAVLG